MKLKATKVKKNSMFCVFLGGIILFALFYFSRQVNREGITSYEFNQLSTKMGVIEKEPISDSIAARNELKRDEAGINSARAAKNSALANYRSADRALTAAINKADATRVKVAEKDALAAEDYAKLLADINTIGITDELYALPIAETGLGTPQIIYDMNILVKDELHIIG
jgi:hypothetical protein